MRTSNHPILATVTVLALPLIYAPPSTADEERTPSGARWVFKPNPWIGEGNQTARKNFETMQAAQNERKLEDQKRGESQEREFEIRKRQKESQLLEVPIKPDTKLSPLEAFRKAFGKPAAPTNKLMPIQTPIPNDAPRENLLHRKLGNLFPKPMPSPSDDQHQRDETSPDSRHIVFIPEKLTGISGSWGHSLRTVRLIPWFAKCERRIRAGCADQKIFDQKSLACLIHFTDSDTAIISILKTSGQPKIDQAALDAVRNGSPFPSPPYSLPRKSDLKVDFNYPILEMSLLNKALPAPLVYVRQPLGAQYVPPDPSLQKYFQWTPPKTTSPKVYSVSQPSTVMTQDKYSLNLSKRWRFEPTVFSCPLGGIGTATLQKKPSQPRAQHTHTTPWD